MQGELVQHIKQAHELKDIIKALQRGQNSSRKRDVFEFQTTVLKVPYPPKPTLLTREELEYNVACVKEELQELLDANNLVDQADAIIDAQYFLEGILHKMGIDSDRVWAEVQRANMDKHRGKTHRGVEGDAAKPIDWKPPNHDWINK